MSIKLYINIHLTPCGLSRIERRISTNAYSNTWKHRAKFDSIFVFFTLDNVANINFNIFIELN